MKTEEIKRQYNQMLDDWDHEADVNVEGKETQTQKLKIEAIKKHTEELRAWNDHFRYTDRRPTYEKPTLRKVYGDILDFWLKSNTKILTED